MDTGATTKAGYHHGDLRNALLAAAEQELTTSGIEGFSLRGVAKRAGVSHAAPAHHFRDTGGMLTALAAIGAERLAASMRACQAECDGAASARFVASGVGYIEFAIANPALFKLMFGSDRPDWCDGPLVHHANDSFGVLLDGVGALRGANPMESEAGMLDVVAAWAMVHGIANLLIANKVEFIDPMLARDFRATIEKLIVRVVPSGG